MVETDQNNSEQNIPVQTPPVSISTNTPATAANVVAIISSGRFQDSDEYKKLVESNKAELKILGALFKLLEGGTIDEDTKKEIEAATGKHLESDKKGVSKFFEELKTKIGDFFKKINKKKAAIGAGIAIATGALLYYLIPLFI